MEYRQLGDTDMKISEVGLGTWQIGGDWGNNVSEQNALTSLNHAVDRGVNFFDTADQYGNGRSEQLLGELIKARSERLYIATKFGRRDDFTDPKNYTYEKISKYCEDSLTNLGVDAIDLYQIHCPTTEILEDSDVFDVLERLKKEGKIRYYGVSVETDAQGEYVINNTNASSLLIIFNMLREKPLKNLIPLAKKNNVGIIARVPLDSGLLAGKFTVNTTFPANDHRNYNQNGQAFNVGETFGGLPFKKGVELADQLKWIQEGRGTMAQAALKWIIQQDGITSVVPGFKNDHQVDSNIEACDLKDFTPAELERISKFYWSQVHDYIRGGY